MRNLFQFLCCFLVLQGTVLAYQSNHNNMMNRRQWFTGAAVAVASMVPQEPAKAIISSKYCAYGSGNDCEDLAEGNELIRALQEKSRVNKEANELEARNSFYMKNYPDWFAAVGKTMVKKSDGSFILVNDDELLALKRENKVGVENAKTMGGKVMDLTQKPILVLKE